MLRELWGCHDRSHDLIGLQHMLPALKALQHLLSLDRLLQLLLLAGASL